MDELLYAIKDFTNLVVDLPDAVLEKAWKWEDYNEGVRFAFFRTYEDLRELAVVLTSLRQASGNLPSQAQLILSQYLVAYREFQSALFNVTDEQATLIPQDGDWSVREAVVHIIAAEGTFFAILSYAIRRSRSDPNLPLEMSDEDWENFWVGDSFSRLQQASAPLSELLIYFNELHSRILGVMSDLLDTELDLPSKFWEEKLMPVRFRLHRFESHLRQHTIQIEKIKRKLNLGQGEIHDLIRLIGAALANVEGALLGMEAIGKARCNSSAAIINQRTAEIRAILAQ